jgi:hypothetical protein
MDCKKALEEKYAAENAAAAEAANERKLPDLTGSVKQIAWATTIREKFVTTNEEGIKPKATAEILPTYEKVLSVILSEQTTADYWIDIRDIVDSSNKIARFLTPYIKREQDAQKINVAG